MTKLLILAYDFPPFVSVGGLRPFSWFKYLNRFDVYPIVVTRQWENRYENENDYISPGFSDSVEITTRLEGTIVQAPFNPTLANKIRLRFGERKFKFIRKLITAYYEFLQFLLPIGNKKEIYYAADEYLKNNDVDCIIATGDPFILFKYASTLSSKYSVPWIADYRDAWIQDKSISNKLLKVWCALFEKKFLRNTYKITTVSTFIQRQIEQNIKDCDFEIIYNGYDPDLVDIASKTYQNESTLSIGTTGTIQDWNPVESFLRVCNELIEEDSGFKLNLNFYGINKRREIEALLEEKFKMLRPHVTIHPKMANREFAKAISSQNVCLLFNDYSILGTKIFDYLAVKRMILFCYRNDSESMNLKEKYFFLNEIDSDQTTPQADIIAETNSGEIIDDAAGLKKTLKRLNDELVNKGFIKCESKGIEKYSRVIQVERLAKIVNESVNNHGK